jgi:RNA polymerase sigma-70 factor (ECF subfamily)
MKQATTLDPAASDAHVVEALRAGDERAFATLVREYHDSLVRVALIYVSTRAVAEEVVQETWLGVLRGLDRFEGRSTLKTWIFRILTNTAKTRAQREGRTIPFSSLRNPTGVPEPSVDPDRFNPDDDPMWPRHWATPPPEWDLPEERLLAGELQTTVEAAIDELPPSQCVVIRMRDVEGYTSEEVCNALEISETNERVLLHRARAKVRQALDDYLIETGSTT